MLQCLIIVHHVTSSLPKIVLCSYSTVKQGYENKDKHHHTVYYSFILYVMFFSLILFHLLIIVYTLYFIIIQLFLYFTTLQLVFFSFSPYSLHFTHYHRTTFTLLYHVTINTQNNITKYHHFTITT